MKKIIFLFLLCISLSTELSAQIKIPLSGYKDLNKADSLIQLGQYENALKLYESCLDKIEFFKGRCLYYSAICHALLKNPSQAKSLVVSSFNHGFKYFSIEQMEQDWLLQSLKSDSTQLINYNKIISQQNNWLNPEYEIEFPSIRDSLLVLLNKDQYYRHKIKGKNDSLFKLQTKIDKENQSYINSILNEFGNNLNWTQVGRDGMHAILLIGIHTKDIDLLERIIKLAEVNLKNHSIEPSDYCILVDKYNYLLFGVQLFGTQVERSKETQEITFKPFLNNSESYIINLRNAFGLISMEDYLKDMKSINN
ncbi:MAG: hypothetical protein R2799_03645 [Crocinitomicaceae bacterium]